jgi:hypothetical protein
VIGEAEEVESTKTTNTVFFCKRNCAKRLCAAYRQKAWLRTKKLRSNKTQEKLRKELRRTVTAVHVLNH